MSNSRMLAGFALYTEPTHTNGDHHTIAVPLGTRLLRIIRLSHGWTLWTSTRDFIHGTYIELHDDGSAYNWTIRVDEGDECFMIRPDDAEIHHRWSVSHDKA